MADLLDGISEVDWAALEHAYGSAEDVPGWLTAMTDPATSGAALGKLDAAVYHQGGAVYPAAVAVVPFLIRFVREPAAPERAGILDVLRSFAALHNEMREPFKSRLEARRTRAALLGAFEDFRVLLDEPDPAVRRGALRVLVELGERADDRADELMRRIPDAPDPDQVLALGAGTGLTARKRATVLAWLREHTPPAGHPGRLTYLVAVRRLDRDAGPAGELLTAYADAVPEPAIDWLGREIGADRTARVALARTAVAQAVRTHGSRPLAEVGTVMTRWRSATVELVTEVAAALDGPPEVRAAAVHLLAASGDAGRRWADEVAQLTGEGDRTGFLAAWALARWGDRRAIPLVERSLRRDPEFFGMGSSHYTDGSYWLTQEPGIADVGLPLADHADELVPAIRWRLRHDAARPTAHQLTTVLSAYGPAAAPALPELIAMLDTEHSPLAYGVLAGLGPAAEPAWAELRQRAGSDRTAAWALFRLTGDAEPLLAGDDVPPPRMLGDLGPLARRHGPDLERRLTADRRYWSGWSSVELAFAHYRITGDPALFLDVLDACLDPLRRGEQLPVSRQALRHLVDLGPAAGRFRSLLRDTVDRDERLRYSGGWRGMAEDDEARTSAVRALAAIGSDPGGGRA